MGPAGVGGKSPAQIKRAAAGFSAQLLQDGRFRQVLFKQEDDLLDALPRDPMLARAEQFRFRRRLKEKGDGQFQSLALVPQRLGGGINRRLPERGDNLLLVRGQAGGGGRPEKTGVSRHRRPDDGMKPGLRAGQMAGEKFAGKLNGQKLVPLTGGAFAQQWLGEPAVKSGGHRSKLLPVAGPGHIPATVQIQA